MPPTSLPARANTQHPNVVQKHATSIHCIHATADATTRRDMTAPQRRHARAHQCTQGHRLRPHFHAARRGIETTTAHHCDAAQPPPPTGSTPPHPPSLRCRRLSIAHKRPTRQPPHVPARPPQRRSAHASTMACGHHGNQTTPAAPGHHAAKGEHPHRVEVAMRRAKPKTLPQNRPPRDARSPPSFWHGIPML
jgi:hypothetical protein